MLMGSSGQDVCSCSVGDMNCVFTYHNKSVFRTCCYTPGKSVGFAIMILFYVQR